MSDHADITELLAQASWVRGLARRLSHDEASGDDLAQEAWLAALRRPPAAGATPRGWFAQVLRNAAHMRHRGASRRARREQAVDAPASVPGADQLAEEVGLGRLLAEVLGLDEPLRETVLLHFYRGLTSTEIGVWETCRCIQETMYAARFAAPTDNGEVQVEYPFVLMPPDDEGP